MKSFGFHDMLYYKIWFCFNVPKLWIYMCIFEHVCYCVPLFMYKILFLLWEKKKKRKINDVSKNGTKTKSILRILSSNNITNVIQSLIRIKIKTFLIIQKTL